MMTVLKEVCLVPEIVDTQRGPSRNDESLEISGSSGEVGSLRYLYRALRSANASLCGTHSIPCAKALLIYWRSENRAVSQAIVRNFHRTGTTHGHCNA